MYVKAGGSFYTFKDDYVYLYLIYIYLYLISYVFLFFFFYLEIGSFSNGTMYMSLMFVIMKS